MNTSTSTTQDAEIVTLPAIELAWKWPRAVNPHLVQVDQDCLHWAESFGAFTPEAQRAFNKGRFNLLTGLAYPYMTKDQLVSACQLMQLFFVIDEYSDKSSPAQVRQQCRVLSDAISNPEKPRPQREWIAGEMARQVALGLSRQSTPTFRRRFQKTWDAFTNGVAEQAELRREHTIHTDLDAYFRLRRQTIGCSPSFALAEMELSIPDGIRYHPVLVEIEDVVKDVVFIVNDIISYNKEQADGDSDHNLVTVIMHMHKMKGHPDRPEMSVQEALDRAGQLHSDRVRRFEELYQQIPRWGGPVDLDVQRLVDGMAWWGSAIVWWSYESGRYFGDQGAELLRTRKMRLLPKKENKRDDEVVRDDDDQGQLHPKGDTGKMKEELEGREGLVFPRDEIRPMLVDGVAILG